MSNAVIEAPGLPDNFGQHTMRWGNPNQRMVLIGLPRDCGPDEAVVCDGVLDEVIPWYAESGIDPEQRIVVFPEDAGDVPRVNGGEPLSLMKAYREMPHTAINTSSIDEATLQLAGLWRTGRSPVCLLPRPNMDEIGQRLKGEILARDFSSSVKGLGEFTVRSLSPETPVGATFKIRDAKPDDAPAIVATHVDSLINSYPVGTAGITHEAMLRRYFSYHTGHPTNIEDRIQSWQETIDDPRQRVFVAVDDVTDRVIGFSVAATHEDGEKWLDGLYVSTDYQGRGVGLFLAQAVLAHHGNEAEVRLEAGAHLPAKRLYEKLGFRKAGSAPDIEPQPGIMVRNDQLMIRSGMSPFSISVAAILRSRHRYNDATLHERLWVSGVRLAEDDPDATRYIKKALVPDRHVRKPSLGQLRRITATPETPPWAAIELVHYSKYEMDEIRTVAYEQWSRYGDTRGIEGRDIVMLPGGVPAVFCSLETMEGDRLTSTKIMPEIDNYYNVAKRVGGHLDGWYNLPIEQRTETPQLLVVCLKGSRYALTIAGPDAMEIGRQLHPGDEGYAPNTRDLQSYYADPDRREKASFVFAELRAGDGYVISPELLGHEGSTFGVQSPSVIAFFHLRDGVRSGRWGPHNVDGVLAPTRD